jgi:Dolichyl-phosphate-mannose-protein mannosyltransferase
LAAWEVPVPWIAPDEMVYGLLGRSLWSTGTLAILGGPTPFYSVLVPAFVGLPLSTGDLEFGYGLLKVVQALVMSLTAVPVFLWGRSLVGRRWAFVAAVLTLAAPALVYSGLVMTEVLFYPVFVLSAWAMARVIEEPTWQRQVWFVVAVGAAVATRLQAVVLVPAFVTAVGLDVLLARSAVRARRFWPVIVALGVLAVAWLGWRLATGEPVLGGYGVVTHASYGVGRAARFVLYHAGSLVILAGVVPVCAFLLLFGAVARRSDANGRVRAYLAVTCSVSVWLVVEVGVFASEYVGRLAERDLIGLAPLYFLGFVVWLARGASRGYWSASFACLLVAVPLVVLPLGKFVTAQALPDAPSLAPLYNLRTASSLVTLEIVFYGVVAAALLLLALLPRRALVVVLPLLLLVVLTGGSVAASRYAADQGSQRQRMFLGSTPTWIDRAAHGPVAYLYQSGSDWTGVWENVFWNRRIDRVYDLGGVRLVGPIPQQQIRIRADGRLVARSGRPVSAPYVVTTTGVVGSEPSFEFAGDPIASTIQPGSQAGGLALWRIDQPLRLSFRTTGIRPNGDIYPGETARLVAYGCSHRVFRVTLLVKQPQTVTIRRNGAVYKRLTFRSPAPDQPWSGAIPALRLPGRPAGTSVCTLDVQTDGLLGSTVFRVDP